MAMDWQNSLTEIKDRGQYLLQTEKWFDCRFLVGTAPNQRLLCGHKLLLAMASPVFERMFYGNLPDKNDPILIPDVHPDAFQTMMEYIYTDRINISSFDKACELCYVAKKYMLPHVVQRCTDFLWADLSPKNACRAYEFAKLFDEPHLMQSSMELISSTTREVIADSSFMDIEVSTLMAILDQNRLNIASELDLFNCLLKFANERGIINDNSGGRSGSSNCSANACENDDLVVEEIKMEPDVAAMMHNHVEEDEEQHDNGYDQASSTGFASTSAAAAAGNSNSVAKNNNITDEVVVVDSDASASGNASDLMSGEDNEANIINIMNTQRTIMDEAMLRQAVKKIRFLTMTPQQFAEGPARSKLLQQHEALAILIKISSPTINDLPMPEGFCTSRSTRNIYESHRSRDLCSFRHSVPPNGPTTVSIGFAGSGSGSAGSGSNVTAPDNNHQMYAIFSNPATIGSLASAPAAAPPPSSSNASIIQASAPQQHVNLGNYAGGDGESSVSTHDMLRSYCVRTVNQQFDYRNTSVTDCGLTFQVDTNIWILGVQVPTQVLCGELTNSAGFSERYTEILYAHIQDMQGSRIAYTHCTSRVRFDSLLDITFDRPVYIYRNQIYKVYVVFNKIGWYTMCSCVPDAVCNRVKFMFNVGNPTESVRDGLIHAIIFSTPQDHSRNMIE